MAIIDDYAGIAAELRRIQAESRAEAKASEVPRDSATGHPMRTTPAGEMLYRRLVLPRRR